MVGTIVYGQSDDNVYFKGDFDEQITYSCAYSGIYIIFNDGTEIIINYRRKDTGIWKIELKVKGNLFDKLVSCNDPDAEIYSDILHLKAGIKCVKSSKNWDDSDADWVEIKKINGLYLTSEFSNN